MSIESMSRRSMLLRTGAGFGALPLAHLLGKEGFGSEVSGVGQPEVSQAELLVSGNAAQQTPHYFGAAKSVIFLFMEGGPSHIDTFDPKPLLNELAGQTLPKSFKRVITAMGEIESPLLESKRKWSQHGECGMWVSDWLPHTAQCADDLAVLRGCWTNGINHSGGVCQMNTGSPLAGRPSLGSWVTYGLGTENENLPSFIVMGQIDDNRAGCGVAFRLPRSFLHCRNPGPHTKGRTCLRCIPCPGCRRCRPPCRWP